MKKVLSYWPVILLIGISTAYYWRVFVGKVPFPGDLLIGAYLPWLEYKWGNVVGVAIKNTLISDIFSQIFLWKNEIARSFSSGEWPLWNPYSYSGYPLLANFQSGALNPFNVLMVIFGSVNGWTLLVMSQTIGSALAMYSYLRTCEREKMSSVIASTIYAFGGFSIIWSQYVNVGFSMIWIPLILASIELAKVKNEKKYLYLLSPLLLLIVLAGHLQALVYSTVITVLYFVFRFGLRNWKYNGAFVLSGLIAIGLSAIQLLPTIELMNVSIRFADDFTKAVNFGLLPGRNIISLIAPDFFGNPSTGNYWGFFDYQESMVYAGVLGVTALVFGIFNFKKLKQGKFFLPLTIFALLMQFDSPFGRAIYQFKIPFLWTSVAGRIALVHLLGMSVLTAEFIENVPRLSLKHKIKIFLPMVLAIIITISISYFSIRFFESLSFRNELVGTMINLKIGLRNLVIPTGLILSLFLIFSFSSKFKYWSGLVLLLVMADLFRFGWKYTPFVPKSYIYPETEITNFIRKDTEVFRVEKELGEIMPQNTWMAYQIMSPSGYDPMAIESYVKSFSKDLNSVEHPGVTRFSEINTYDAKALGSYNVKYLLAIKRDREAKLGGEFLNHSIDIKQWNKAFETKEVAVLQNKFYQGRARIIDSDVKNASGTAEIVSFTNNKVTVNFSNVDGKELLLADTYYPGWEAKLNSTPIEINQKHTPFRSVDISDVREGQITFEYKPKSFTVGLQITSVCGLIWLFLIYRSFFRTAT